MCNSSGPISGIGGPAKELLCSNKPIVTLFRFGLIWLTVLAEKLIMGGDVENLLISIRSERTTIILPNGRHIELYSKCVSIPYISAALRPGQSVCRKPTCKCGFYIIPSSSNAQGTPGKREQNDCKSQRSGFERNSVSGRGRATTLRTGASQSHSKMMRKELRCPHASLRSYGWLRLLRESV